MTADRFNFRAWDKKLNRMWDDIQTMYDTLDWTDWPADCGCCFYDFIEEKNMIVMQSTGMTDTKNDEIYEGDIVKVIALANDHNQKGARNVAVVCHFNGNMCLDICGSKTGPTLYPFNVNHSIAVIGNIHENPELLEKS